MVRVAFDTDHRRSAWVVVVIISEEGVRWFPIALEDTTCENKWTTVNNKAKTAEYALRADNRAWYAAKHATTAIKFEWWDSVAWTWELIVTQPSITNINDKSLVCKGFR